MKYSIVTPTVLRNSFIRTCKSVDDQSFIDYEHIVSIDIPQNELSKEHITIINTVCHNARRKFIYMDKIYRDFGNTPRNRACNIASGMYIMYLDDDDFYINDTLKQIDIQLQKYGNSLPDMAVFRCLRAGTEFTNFPPALCMTTSCQWMHKKYIRGNEIAWPTTDQGYYSDGNFLESVKRIATPVLLKTDKQLVCVDVYSGGRR